MADMNRLSEELKEPAVTEIDTSIGTMRSNLPFLISLTPEERQSLPKLGDNRLALDEDAYTRMKQHPELRPAFVDEAELEKDWDLRAKLDRIRLALASLLSDVESTEMVLGSEMLTAYLAFYANAQEAAKRGVAGAQAVVDVLSKYFARRRRPAA